MTQEGTSARSFVNAPYKTGGKTGTAQVIEIKANEKYNASKIDERHRDHALYTAFAPLEEPRVAIALIVENAGFGAANAAPIARRVFDYLLSGKYPSEADIAAVQLGQATAPIGVPRAIDTVPLPGATVDGAATARAEPVATPAPAPSASRLPLTGPRAGRAICWRCDATEMSAVFDSPSLWQRARPVFTGYDVPLVLAVALLALAGLVTMYSAGFDHGTRFVDHGRNMALAFVVLFLVAQIPPQQLIKLAIPLYVVGLILLLATALPGLGITRKGATRWLNVGVTIQPSEILKIAMPLMLAWWFQRREGQLRVLDFVIAGGPAARAGRHHRQAARPRHGDPGPLGRPLRDLLRRPVVEADHPGDDDRGGGHHRGRRLGREDLPARRQVADAARLPEEPRLHPARPDHRSRSARASTSSRARSRSARAAPPARAS